MSRINDVVQRAISDGAFRAQLRSDPARALRGFSLSPEETQALTGGDPAKLVSLGVDQRMSKLFFVFDGTSHAFTTSGGDVSGAAHGALTSTGGAIAGAHSGTQARGDPDYLVSGQDAGAALISGGDEAHASLQPGRAVGSGEDLLVTTSGNDDTSAFISSDEAHAALQPNRAVGGDPDYVPASGNADASLSTGENQIDTGAQVDSTDATHDSIGPEGGHGTDY